MLMHVFFYLSGLCFLLMQHHEMMEIKQRIEAKQAKQVVDDYSKKHKEEAARHKQIMDVISSQQKERLAAARRSDAARVAASDPSLLPTETYVSSVAAIAAATTQTKQRMATAAAQAAAEAQATAEAAVATEADRAAAAAAAMPQESILRIRLSDGRLRTIKCIPSGM
jgi:hypothetical protein